MTREVDRKVSDPLATSCAHVADGGAAGALSIAADVTANIRIASVRRGGGVPVDLDEALQGLYQGALTVSEAASKHSSPSPSGGGEPGGIGGYVFSVAVGIPVAIFSALAIRGGWAEFTGAREHGALLRARLEQSRAAREVAIRQVVDGLPEGARMDYVVHDQVCDDLTAEQARNRSAAGIGLSAWASGVTMLARVTADAALRTALVIAARGFDVGRVIASSPLAAALTAGMAKLGTIVLGPLAGILATVLGGFYLHQSRLQFRRLDKDRVLVRAAMTGQPGACDAVQRYRQFVLRKVDKRHRFLRRFRNWNAAFLTGGLLFGGVAVIKAGIGIAALLGLGVGVLTGPFAILALLAIGTVGAVLLGVSSVPFITQGGKNKRHQLQYAGDHPEVDRYCLAPLDSLAPRADGASAPASAPQGQLLRSQLYNSILQRKKAVAVLLFAAARGQRHRVRAGKHPDLLEAGTRMGTLDRQAWGFGPSGSRQAWMACRAFLGALAAGHGVGHACLRATSAYRDASPESRLARWLQTADGLSAQTAFMQACLKTQHDYLTAKVATLKRASAGPDPGACPRPDNVAPALPQQLNTSIRADEQALKAIASLQAELADISETTAAALTDRFLALQGAGRVQPSGEDARQALARFCLDDLSPRLGEMAGVLVATELHAARLGDRWVNHRITG